MKVSLDNLLLRLHFLLLCAILVISPWLFGAWEAWYFWPFATAVFVSTLIFSLHLMACALHGRNRTTHDNTRIAPACLLVVLPALLFLSYAIWRFTWTEVRSDAERNVMIFTTAFLVITQILYALNTRRIALLFRITLVNLCALGCYGILNHLLFESSHVLWMPGYEQYTSEFRATGSYFCPNHFAGIMEIACGLGLGLLLDRGSARNSRILGCIACAIAVTGVFLSKSRGGTITLIAVFCAASAWGLIQWPRNVRFHLVTAAACLVLLAGILFTQYNDIYVRRFNDFIGWEHLEETPAHRIPAEFANRVKAVWNAPGQRGNMIAGALRAWRTNRMFGIGPGMHQNLWAHFAPTPDGDRDLAIWPSMPNNTFHSYEVHSDWVQLLEEYGIAGFILFCAGCAGYLFLNLRFFTGESRSYRNNDWLPVGTGSGFGMVLGSFLASTAMAFHSLGDFNLQMPATAWLTAAIAATGTALCCRTNRNNSGLDDKRPGQ